MAAPLEERRSIDGGCDIGRGETSAGAEYDKVLPDLLDGHDPTGSASSLFTKAVMFGPVVPQPLPSLQPRVRRPWASLRVRVHHEKHSLSQPQRGECQKQCQLRPVRVRGRS